MPITIELRDEQGGLVQEGGIVESRELPDFDDARYPYLQLVDPYGNTIFNRSQCSFAVVAEIERFALERPSPNLERLLALAERCRQSVHTYLWLIGD